MKKSNVFRPVGIAVMVSMLALTSCKKDKVDEPIEYNFEDDFKDVKLDDLVETEPDAVESTESTYEDSPAAIAAAAALANGELSAELQSATTAVSGVISTDEANELSGAFTADVVDGLAAGGSLDPALQAKVDALTSTGALDAFLPNITAPTVNGVEVSARKGGDNSIKTIADFNLEMRSVTDECSDKAKAAFDAVKGTLDAAKQSQVSSINATYTAREAAINAEFDSKSGAVPVKWADLRAAAKNNAALMVGGIEAAVSSGKVDAGLGAILKAIAYANMASTIAKIKAAELADLNAVGLTKDAKIASAAAARDKDLAAVDAKYSTVLGGAQTIYTNAANSCHNQGGVI